MKSPHGEATPSKVWICGPILGAGKKGMEAFADARITLENLGYEVISPTDNEQIVRAGIAIVKFGKGVQDAFGEIFLQYMIYKLVEMIKCDYIYLLSGWDDAFESQIELLLATQIGMEALRD